jgi:decaprenylphospho-beta-D-erythro-pentofuranosid-2-ulose 2-reductase
LGNQKACELSYEVTEQQLRINFLSVVSLLTPIANYFEAQGHGCIAVISSVAGERGRQSNYVYGTAKGAVKVFLQGLRNRLYHSGVSVITVNPGFVDTPMTAELPKNFLFAAPTSVGNGIYKAIIRSKDIVYLPWFWRWIMMGLRLVPEGIFKRMRI